MGELYLDQFDKIVAQQYERSERDSFKEAEKEVEDFNSSKEPGEGPASEDSKWTRVILVPTSVTHPILGEKKH
jgi:hypothetical protein